MNDVFRKFRCFCDILHFVWYNGISLRAGVDDECCLRICLNCFAYYIFLLIIFIILRKLCVEFECDILNVIF